jgi:hypothetical protein
MGHEKMSNEAIDELTARWSLPNGLPFKGKLVSDDGCMCAQGQALHYIGGYSAADLQKMRQAIADKETARLLGISTIHAILLRTINDSVDGAPSIVLTHPEQVLGDQANLVLAFWKYLDSMDDAAWAAIDTEITHITMAAWNAARDAAVNAAGFKACRAAGMASLQWCHPMGCFTNNALHEILGASVIRSNGQPFYFLPRFGFADPEAVLSASV